MTDKEKKQVRKYLLQSYAKKFKSKLFKRIDNGEKSYYYKRVENLALLIMHLSYFQNRNVFFSKTLN